MTIPAGAPAGATIGSVFLKAHDVALVLAVLQAPGGRGCHVRGPGFPELFLHE